MTTGLKTRLKKVAEHHQPKDIQEMPYGKAQTTARKAFLAAKLAEVNALPNRSAKIVGGGSYAYVAEYEVVQTEGRLRHRGHCQFCGCHQVVEDLGLEHPRLVKHGYKRPGIGYIFNVCPGAGEPPLERSQAITDMFLASGKLQLINTTAALEAAEQENKVAVDALYTKELKEREPGAYEARPQEPRAGRASEKTSPEFIAKRAAWHKAMAQWAKQFPKHARYEQARSALAVATEKQQQSQAIVQHFQSLIDAAYLGHPLIEEVVA